MSSYNHDRFHYVKFDRALQHYKADELDDAEEICASLVTEVRCPRLVQIQAWQLRSICTINYWRAKAMLGHAMEVCSTLEEDKVVKEYREHTEAMVHELESIWIKRWAAEGREPPEEECMEDTYTWGDEEMEAKADAEMLALEYEQLNLMGEHAVRGGSPPLEGVHGGSTAPWIKSTQQPSAATIVTDAPQPPVPASPTDTPGLEDLPPLPSPAASEDGAAGADVSYDVEMRSDDSL